MSNGLQTLPSLDNGGSNALATLDVAPEGAGEETSGQ